MSSSSRAGKPGPYVHLNIVPHPTGGFKMIILRHNFYPDKQPHFVQTLPSSGYTVREPPLRPNMIFSGRGTRPLCLPQLFGRGILLTDSTNNLRSHKIAIIFPSLLLPKIDRRFNLPTIPYNRPGKNKPFFKWS